MSREEHPDSILARLRRGEPALPAAERAEWEKFLENFERSLERPPLPVIDIGEILRDALADDQPPAPARTVVRRGRGAPEALYPREEIVRVLHAWRGRRGAPQRITPGSLERPGFTRKAVRRVIALDAVGAFELGPRGGLKLAGINGEFRPARKLVSLRALERALGLGSLD